jgi:hypothetical protein
LYNLPPYLGVVYADRAVILVGAATRMTVLGSAGQDDIADDLSPLLREANCFGTNNEQLESAHRDADAREQQRKPRTDYAQESLRPAHIHPLSAELVFSTVG